MKKQNIKPNDIKELTFNSFKNTMLLVFLLILLPIYKLIAQDAETYTDEDTISSITSDKYKKNPAQYLKYLDSTKIPNGILIDRTIFRSDMGLFNGKSKVKTCDYYIWKRLYNSLKYSYNDTGYFPPVNIVREIAISMIRSDDQLVPIAIINMKYSKIMKKALTSKALNESDTCLIVERTADKIYRTKQICAATTFDHVLHGPEIKFLISPMFIFLNDTTEKIKGIDIDFGDGNGFIKTQLNEPISVNYGSTSKYIIAKIKITYSSTDSTGKKDKNRYTHFTFLYSGTDAVPEPATISKKSSLKSTPKIPDKNIYLINGDTNGASGDVWSLEKVWHHCWWANFGLNVNCDSPQTTYYNDQTVITDCYNPSYTFKFDGSPSQLDLNWTRTPGNYDIEANILWGSGNSSGMLRKSIIISDAFDPDNMRNYYCTHQEFDPDSKKFDPRGLYQILNGDKSAWSTDNGATLAQDLTALGYDIVFLNYKSGDGDIPANAQSFEGLLDWLNNNLRDNQTEEFILVGPSMGGIITRYCLTSMENSGKEHHVKMWFSFDSPQEGASIPLGLQYGVNYLQNRTIVNWMSNGSLNSSLGALRSPAARQMLIQQYEYANPEPKDGTPTLKSRYDYTAGNDIYSNFYSTLRQKGYPLYSKNIAISNGGTMLLYPDASDNMILDYHSDGVAWTRGFELNANGYRQSSDASSSNKIFHGNFVDGASNDYDIYLTSGAIPFDNAPGGYNTSLYTFNHTSNDHQPHCDGKVWCEKATFMPTVSAFGIVPTNDNVHKTWQDINLSETPFDFIYGTSYGDCEEHVRVSDNTSIWLKKYIADERKNIQKPYPHTTPYTETESKPSLITASQSIILGGVSGSNFVIKSGADVKVIAPSITFEPGFKVESGAKFYASTGSVVNGSQKSAIITPSKPPVSYLEPSPYNNKVYDYSENNLPTLIADDKFIYQSAFTIYPNPVSNQLIIEYIGQWIGETNVQVRNIMGQSVAFKVYQTTYRQSLDLSNVPSGIYLVSITNGNKTYFNKIIKK